MKPRPYTVTEIKDFALSADGTQATFTLVAKYAGEMVVTMPASCLEALKSPQDRAPAVAKAKSGETRKGTLHGRKNGSWETRRRNTKSSRSSSIPSPTGRLALPSARSRRTTWRPGSLKAPTPSRPTSRPGRINTAKARADLPHGRPDPGVRRRQNTASPTFRPMKCRIDWFDITRACATAACARRETTPCSCDPFGGIVSILPQPDQIRLSGASVSCNNWVTILRL
jgi:hypothetical protein